MERTPARIACLRSFVLLCFLLSLYGCQQRDQNRETAKNSIQTKTDIVASTDASVMYDRTEQLKKTCSKQLWRAYQLPLTDGKGDPPEEEESFLLQKDADRHKIIMFASSFIKHKYEISYHDLEMMEQILKFHRTYCDFYPEGMRWEDENETIGSISYEASYYWEMITKSKTIMKASFLTEDKMLYHNGEDICRGLLVLQIDSCSDFESLKKVVDLGTITECGTYACAYELVLCYRKDLLSADFVLGKEESKHRLYLKREVRIGEWEKIDS